MKRATLAMSLLLAGCTNVSPIIRNADLVIYPRFLAQSQALLPNNTLASIATLDIVPYIEDTPGVFKPISLLTGNATVPEDPNLLKLSASSPSIDPNRPFVVRKLKPNKNYRVYGRAYNSANALISQDASSCVAVNVGIDDAPSMAQLPVQLINVPFGASTAVTVNTDGRYDYLTSTLYLVSDNTQVAVSQTALNNPTVTFAKLQGNTSYKLVVEAYKFGGAIASSTLNLDIGSDNTPATSSLSLTIPYYISTIAGNGATFFAGDGGQATSATLNQPYGVAADGAGNLYIGDQQNHRVRKVWWDGHITTLAGNGTATYNGDGIQATAASLKYPYAVLPDAAGNVYVADCNNLRIRKISTTGIITTVAGNGTDAFAGDNGQAVNASISYPHGIALDAAGNLYIADCFNHRVRKVSTGGVITTIAGNGATGFSGDGGQAVNASLYYPTSIAFDSAGNCFISDCFNGRIRKVAPSGIISTIAGNGATSYSGDGGQATSAGIYHPYGIAFDASDNLIISDSLNNRIRRVSSNGIISTIAGNGATGFGGNGGRATSASMNNNRAISLDPAGNIYVADFLNHCIRKLQ